LQGFDLAPPALPTNLGSGWNAKAGLGLIAFPGKNGYSRNLYDTTWNNVSPRVGAIYQLGRSYVLRGGYGRIYMPSNTGFNANGGVYGTSPFAGTATPIPYGISPNGRPVGTFDEPQNTEVIQAVGANQAPSIYGGSGGTSGLFIRHGVSVLFSPLALAWL
jgi:hypothetical protein